METWGYCQPCERWFYCPKWFDQAAPQPVCPVCGSEPTAIENRQPATGPRTGSEPAPTAVQLQTLPETALATDIKGLCPKCERWFACDDWFDHQVPLPCCPDCHLAPSKLRYRWSSPRSGSDLIEIDTPASDLWLG